MKKVNTRYKTGSASEMPFNAVGCAWMTAQQAAQYVGRHSATAYKTMLRLAREGKIRAGHDGKTFKFKADDLDAFLYLNGKAAQS